MKALEGHNNGINALSVFASKSMPGGALIISGCTKGNIRVWSPTGEMLRVFNGHIDEVFSLSTFENPDDANGSSFIILSGGKDMTVRTWLSAEEKSLTILRHDVFKEKKEGEEKEGEEKDEDEEEQDASGGRGRHSLMIGGMAAGFGGITLSS